MSCQNKAKTHAEVTSIDLITLTLEVLSMPEDETRNLWTHNIKPKISTWTHNIKLKISTSSLFYIILKALAGNGLVFSIMFL